MRSFLSRNIKIIAPVAVIGTVVVAYLAFAVFGIHTLFIDDKVNEDGPVFASGAGASPAEDEIGDADDPVGTVVEEMDDEADDEMPEPESTDSEIMTLASGSFIDRSHPAEGTALVLTDGTSQRFLRFEDFATDNGPDLNVYLSTAPPGADASEFDDDFIDLGDLKGNIGNQNYEIPADVDLDRYQSVVIWCVRFGVAFGAAELA